MLPITEAANLKGIKAMERRENKITETIELLKHSMFKDAKMEVLSQFKDLKVFGFNKFLILFKHICCYFLKILASNTKTVFFFYTLTMYFLLFLSKGADMQDP